MVNNVQGGPPHPDDVAVNQFATEIKAALARARRRGRGGWRDANVITTGGLARQMAAQFLKRTPSTWVDIAAYAMMLHCRGADPAVLAEAMQPHHPPGGRGDVMMRTTLELEGGFLSLKQLRAPVGQYVLTVVADNGYDYESGYTLVAPARALELTATSAQVRQIAEAILARLEGGAK